MTSEAALCNVTRAVRCTLRYLTWSSDTKRKPMTVSLAVPIRTSLHVSQMQYASCKIVIHNQIGHSCYSELLSQHEAPITGSRYKTSLSQALKHDLTQCTIRSSGPKTGRGHKVQRQVETVSISSTSAVLSITSLSLKCLHEWMTLQEHCKLSDAYAGLVSHRTG